MAKIVLARIDDRLIHGQVVIKWVRAVPCDEILICDDQVRADPFLQKVLALAAPPQVALSVKSVAETVAYLAENAHSARRILLLMKSPRTALELLRAGVHLPLLVVGGMAAAPGTRRIYKSISATPAQIEELRTIRRLGTRIRFQTVPEPEESGADFDALFPGWGLSEVVAHPALQTK